MKMTSGFTFVEIIITISVISIMSAVALANYNTIRTQQEIDEDRQEVTSALRQAQTDALALPIDSITSDEVCKIGLIVNTSQDKLEWKYWTESSGVCSTQNDFPPSAGSKDDVELEFAEIDSAGPNEVSFSVPFGELTNPSSEEEITLRRGDEEQKVRIYPSGYITVVQ